MRAGIIQAAALIIITFSAAKVSADQQWEEALSLGLAYSNDDPVFAMSKFRDAWHLVGVSNLQSEPYNKIRQAMAHVSMDYIAMTYRDLSNEQVNERIRVHEITYNTGFSDWNASLSPDGNIVFTPPKGAFEVFPICGGSLDGLTPEQRKAKEAMIEEQEAEYAAEMRKLLPVVLRPGSPKYDEALRLCGNLSGTPHSVRFDLNPYLPPKVQSSDY